MSSIAAHEVLASEMRVADGLCFRHSLSGQRVSDAIERHGVDFRDRAFPPDITLMAYCGQVISPKSSCREAVAKVNRDREVRGLPRVSDSTSAYSQARGRIPLGLIQDLARTTAQTLEASCPTPWLWKEHHVKLVDGTTISMPDTPSNQAKWPQHGQQDVGVGFPIVRCVGLISLATGACLDFAYGPFQGKETGEHALFRQLHGSIKFGDVVLADCYYSSYFLMAELTDKGAFLVSRLHGSRDADFREGQRLGDGDHIVVLKKPPRPKWMSQEVYDETMDELRVREIKVGYKDDEGRDVVVVTTLLDPEKYTKSELIGAYKLRWNVELDLRSLKTVMGMDILSCQTPDMIDKEIWTYILAYNLLRELIAIAAERHKHEPRDISFTGAICVFNAYLPLLLHAPNPEFGKRMYDAMIDQIAGQKICKRPGRSEPRAVKRRPKPFPRLNKPRNQLRKKTTS